MNGAVFDPTQRTAPGPQPPTIMRPVSNPWKEERPGFSASVDSSVARANRVLREHRESAFPRALDFAGSRPDIVSTLGPSRPTKGTVAPPSQRDSGSNLMLVDARFLGGANPLLRYCLDPDC